MITGTLAGSRVMKQPGQIVTESLSENVNAMENIFGYAPRATHKCISCGTESLSGKSVMENILSRG